MPRSLALLLVFLVSAAAAEVDVGGHTKFNIQPQYWPDDSIVRDAIGSRSFDAQGILRTNLEWRKGGWSFDAAYQLIAAHGDTLDLAAGLPPGTDLLIPRLPDDSRRLFDLTHVISDSGSNALLHRLDRLWLGYSNDKAVVRIGRQALSWGNGLFYAPMDLVNPFDPAAIDTEYKPGDDMLYAQYLRDNGEDLQGAIVVRRDPVSGDVRSDESTYALKYHGFAATWEFDLLAAMSYDDPVVAVGGGRDIGGAVWRADVVVTDTDNDTYVQVVSNLNFSWIFRGKNMNGILEYHYNGFGQPSGEYDPVSLASNPDLLARLARGQLFTLGRHYLAASVMVEVSPLWTVTPVMLANIADPSALLQLTTNYSIGDNMTFLGSLNFPLGSSGSEFGGIETGIPGRYFSSGPGVFAQFAFYF